MKIFMGLYLLSMSSWAWAFVENVNHGYVNCMACHVSPSGGGLLNDYGRSLSKELMSTWGWKNSEKPLFGAIENKEWLKVGGHVRSIQTYRENAEIKQGQHFLMQRNIELGLYAGPVWVVGTFGTQEGPNNIPRKGRFLSERHYVLWETSGDTRLRVGKFRMNYGLNDPNHTRWTKNSLGFGANSESYNMEFVKMADNYEIFVTSSVGNLDLPRDNLSERSLSAVYANYVGSKSKVGINALVGESLQQRRTLMGVFAAVTPFEESVAKLEANWQRSHLSTSAEQKQDLLVGFASFGYYLIRGVLPYIFFEYLDQDVSDSNLQQMAPGIGLQWLPIPHLELQAEYRRQESKSTSGGATDVGWLLFHFYL